MAVDTQANVNMRSGLRKDMIDLLTKYKDPGFAQFALYHKGYNVQDIQAEASAFSGMFGGKQQASVQNPNAIPGENIDQSGLTAVQAKDLYFGQRMYQANKILSKYDEQIAGNTGLVKSFKQKANELMVGGTLTNQFVSGDFQMFDQAKRDFINAVLRPESGAVISDAEFENAAKQYFPVPGDTPEQVAQKRANREIVTTNLLKAGGAQPQELAQPQSGQTGSGLDENTIGGAIEWAKKNPNNPSAQKLITAIQNGTIDPITGQKRNLTDRVAPASSATDAISTGGKIGEGLGSFFGGNKIGEAIGNVIGGQMAKHGEAGKMFQETLMKLKELKDSGKLSDEKYQKLVSIQEQGMRDAFGYDGPSVLQVLGDTGKIAVSTLGGAELRGATWLATAGRSALWGAGYGATNATAEGKSAKDTAIDTVLNGVLGGAVPIASKVLGKGVNAIVGKNTPAEALGEILQGKTKDLTPGQKVFSVLDTKGVKTFDELGSKIDGFISQTAKAVDDVLAKEGKIFTPSEMITVGTTNSGKKVETNFVTEAIKQLQAFYAKAGDKVMSSNFGELLQKAETEGLSTLEINQLARHYGIDFGDKAFNKLGDPLSSVSAQMFENVRKGLKEVARRGVNGEQAKKLDSLIGDSITVRNLVRKNIEAVNRLEQKASKMGIGEKLFRGATRIADIATLGGVSGFRKFFQQSNVGNKTMNYLDIESHLSGNLKILRKALETDTPGEFEKALRGVNKSILEKVKEMRGKAGLSLEDVSTPAQKRAATLSKKQAEKDAVDIAEAEKMFANGPNAQYEAGKKRAFELAKGAVSFDDFLKKFKKPNVKIMKQIFLDAKNSIRK